MLEKIISGGQTGADRAALDAALANDFPAGGYCPAGRRSEDGKIGDQYPLIEITDATSVPDTAALIKDLEMVLAAYDRYLTREGVMRPRGD